MNYWRLGVAAILFMAGYYFLSPTDSLLLAVLAIVCYLLSGSLAGWLKKSFRKPIILFDLHGVLIDGDLQVENLREIPGTRSLIRRLRSKYFVAALTNFSPELINFYDKKFGLMAEFDAFFYSGKYGIRKPDARIFDIVIKGIGVRPSDIVFLDDVEENVAAAKKAGLQAILFKNPSQAEAALREMGVNA